MKFLALATSCLVSACLSASCAEPWLNNNLGLEHSAPPPFEKVIIKDNNIQIWGRTITLNGAALPGRVISQKEDMLAGEVAFSIETDGAPVLLSPQKLPPKLIEQHDDFVVFEGIASAPGVTIKVNTQVWFDGLTRIRAVTESGDNLEVKRFSIQVPLNPESVGLNYQRPFYGYAPHVLRDTWGVISGQRNFPFLTDFILSGHNTRFCWIAEYPKDWYLQRRTQVLQVIGSEEVNLFRANFIDAYGKARIGGRSLDFSMLWGPVRPPLKDNRRYHEIWWEGKPAELLTIDPEMRPMVLAYPFSVDSKTYEKWKGTPNARPSRKSFGMPDPEDPKGFAEWCDETRQARGIICPYVNADNFNPLDPDGKNHLQEWSAIPLPGKFEKADDGFSPLYGLAACFKSRSWADYFVWKSRELFDQYKFNGYYMDNCAPRICTNPNHAECQPYVDELGRKWAKNPFHASRELYLRFYRAIKASNPDAVFFANGGDLYPFWDFCLTSEAVGNLGGLWSDVLKREDLNGSFLSGRQRGSSAIIYSTKDDTVEKQRDLIALAVINDTLSCWYLNADEWKKLTRNTIVPFQLWSAEFIPFWANSEIVGISSPDVIPTLYRCADGERAILFLADPWGKTGEVTVTINPGKLFPGYSGKIKVENVETREVYPASLRMVYEQSFEDCKVIAKAKDFVILAISKEKK